jgi:hypothetical protein
MRAESFVIGVMSILFCLPPLPAALGQTISQNSGAAAAPYSATLWTTTTDANSDGSLSTRTWRVDFARTSSGMVMRKAYRPSTGSSHDLTTAPTLIVIHDPVHNRTTSLHPDSHSAVISPMLTPPHPTMGNSAAFNSTFPAVPVSPKTVSLGSGIINGLGVTGSSRTYSAPAPAGMIGVDVLVTEQIWFSSDLHILVKSEMHDTLNRSRVEMLDGIQRSEPDPSLFTVPSDYLITHK